MNRRLARPLTATALLAFALPVGALALDLWADRPLKIVQTTAATFPPTLAAQGVSEGEVRVVLKVDAQGKLLDFLMTDYTDRELAIELANVIRDWTFEPAMQRGEAIGARTPMNFTFEAHGIVSSQTSTEAMAAATNRLIGPTMTSVLCRATELDQPLRAVHVVPPKHPGKSVPQPPAEPKAVIDFYVDVEGRPRMLAVLRASHDLYAAAAMDALLEWRFTPPTRNGQPAMVRVTQTFAFVKKSP